MHAPKVFVSGTAIAALVLAAALLNQVTTVDAAPKNTDPRRAYYLTTTSFTGSEALTACATGYHMASYYEIANPSALRYETTLGLVLADQGGGPPSGGLGGFGWVRSGTGEWGRNCQVWTSNDGEGPIAFFGLIGEALTPGLAVRFQTCAWTTPVWCVQN